MRNGESLVNEVLRQLKKGLVIVDFSCPVTLVTSGPRLNLVFPSQL